MPLLISFQLEESASDISGFYFTHRIAFPPFASFVQASLTSLDCCCQAKTLWYKVCKTYICSLSKWVVISEFKG